MMNKFGSRFLGQFRVASGRSASQAGFTLLEIVIVLGILGTLMAVLVGGIGSGGAKAKIKETGVKAANIQAKLLQYQSDVGSFPSTADGLQSLMTNPGSSAKWGGPYFTAEDDIKDAWNNPFEYELTAKGNKLVSAGADGQSGTEDDVAFLNGREVEAAAAPAAGAGEGGQSNQ
ncbi:MAG: prepilin-type N-terminal cleavage/methylation domain-containing protein [Betaproteobacteria bacterium]|nr:prepilin-type N-terminal cleavage/methylation domain-containing protein [Betaproteobacteria bacterium]